MNINTPELLLIFPPGWSTSSPYLSVPHLAACLERKGIPHRAVDLNIRTINSILSDVEMKLSADRIEELLRSDIPSTAQRKELSLALDLFGIINGRVDSMVAKLRDGNISPREVSRIYRFIDTAYRVYSAPFYPGRIREGALVYYSQDDLLNNHLPQDNFEIVSTITALKNRAEEGGETNPFHGKLEQFTNETDLSNVAIVGLSVCGYSQLVSALSLAQMFKLRKPEIRVVMGGAIMPYLASSLGVNPALFDYVDMIISGSGETALIDAYDNACGKIPITQIGGAIYYDAERKVLVRNDSAPGFDMDELPVSRFDPEELRLYLTPQEYLALPVMGSKGCYWGKCAFCGINCNYDGRVVRKRSELLVEDMQHLAERYGINRFRLIDNCIHPNKLREISEVILARGYKFLWQCMARLEPDFTPDLWEQLYESGLRVASFGLESPNQYMLDMMNKGVRAEAISPVLNGCHRAGIFVHCFIIVGFPGEQNITPDDTVDFIRNNRYNIDSIIITSYRLESQSPVFNNMEKFGIEPARSYPLDYIGSTYEHRDFCRVRERLSYISEMIADIECGGLGYYGIEDMFIIGGVFQGKREEQLSWIGSRIAAYRTLGLLLSGSDIGERFPISSLKPLKINDDYAVFYNPDFFNYYVFEPFEPDGEAPRSMDDYIDLRKGRDVEYLYDLLSETH